MIFRLVGLGFAVFFGFGDGSPRNAFLTSYYSTSNANQRLSFLVRGHGLWSNPANASNPLFSIELPAPHPSRAQQAYSTMRFLQHQTKNYDYGAGLLVHA